MTGPDETRESKRPLQPKVQGMGDNFGHVQGEKFEKAEGDEQERGNWDRKIDFLLSCIGYAVGFGNLWRFPYLCYMNGGGAFLFPYFTMLFLAGLPLFFMEFAMAQFSSEGPVTIWKISPLFKGIGYAMVWVSGLTCVFYNMLMAYTLYFTYYSFASVVPWGTCGNEWNTENCEQAEPEAKNCTGLLNFTAACLSNTSAEEKVSSSEEFWRYKVLDITDGVDDMGGIRWSLFLCLVLAWVIVYFCLFKGVKVSGKVVYFTATFPYFVLVVLFIRGLTLPGHGDGIKYYLTPDTSKLLDAKVWGAAALQIFFSLGPCWGGLMAFASYNKFKNNVYRDALVVALINCFTSFFAGFVVFSVLGYMAYKSGKEVADVVTSGPGLAFVAYPQAIALLPLSPLWAILFFLMLFTLGIDSQFAMMETVISGLSDAFPRLRRYKAILIAVICIVFFILGLPLVFRGGIYVLTLMNWYVAGMNLMVVGIFECIGVAYVYGANRFMKDIKFMLGFYPTPKTWWMLCWLVISPVVLLFILIFSIYEHDPLSYGSYDFPTWADGLGWLLSVVPIALLFGYMIYLFVVRFNGSVLGTLREISRASEDWGPALQKDRQEYDQARSTWDTKFGYNNNNDRPFDLKYYSNI